MWLLNATKKKAMLNVFLNRVFAIEMATVTKQMSLTVRVQTIRDIAEKIICRLTEIVYLTTNN